jgi:predicted membrane protein (TIGR00267 family)
MPETAGGNGIMNIGIHNHPGFLSDFILGSQDGLVNVLGIVLGVSAATTDLRLIFVAALAALGAESISMGAVAYTSTKARLRSYMNELRKESAMAGRGSRNNIKEVEAVLLKWGFSGSKLHSTAEAISSNKNAMLEFMMAFKLKLAPLDRDAPRRSFIVVLSSTIFGSIIPLLPYVFLFSGIYTKAIASVIISSIFLFMIGVYEARKTGGSAFKNGTEMLAIGIAAGLAGYLIGRVFGGVPT